MGALPTALSDWSATIGGTTAFIDSSERMLATTSEETRRIMGWRLAPEAAGAFAAELLSTFSDIAGSWMCDVFRERSLHNSERQSLEIALFWALTGTEYFRSLLALIFIAEVPLPSS